jgi:hypothetical protein
MKRRTFDPSQRGGDAGTLVEVNDACRLDSCQGRLDRSIEPLRCEEQTDQDASWHTE